MAKIYKNVDEHIEDIDLSFIGDFGITSGVGLNQVSMVFKAEEYMNEGDKRSFKGKKEKKSDILKKEKKEQKEQKEKVSSKGSDERKVILWNKKDSIHTKVANVKEFIAMVKSETHITEERKVSEKEEIYFNSVRPYIYEDFDSGIDEADEEIDESILAYKSLTRFKASNKHYDYSMHEINDGWSIFKGDEEILKITCVSLIDLHKKKIQDSFKENIKEIAIEHENLEIAENLVKKRVYENAMKASNKYSFELGNLTKKINIYNRFKDLENIDDVDIACTNYTTEDLEASIIQKAIKIKKEKTLKAYIKKNNPNKSIFDVDTRVLNNFDYMGYETFSKTIDRIIEAIEVKNIRTVNKIADLVNEFGTLRAELNEAETKILEPNAILNKHINGVLNKAEKISEAHTGFYIDKLFFEHKLDPRRFWKELDLKFKVDKNKGFIKSFCDFYISEWGTDYMPRSHRAKVALNLHFMLQNKHKCSVFTYRNTVVYLNSCYSDPKSPMHDFSWMKNEFDAHVNNVIFEKVKTFRDMKENLFSKVDDFVTNDFLDALTKLGDPHNEF